VPRTIFRPAIVLGDSRRPETTQFDMVQAFSVLASLPVLPLKPTDRIDIVPADYVGKAVVAIHQKDAAKYPRYHLSSGTGSQTYRELTDALAQAGSSHPKYMPSLGGTFSSTVNWLSHKKNNLGRGASLLKVFWPYLVWNTVFDNSRVVEELSGETPAKFSSYAQPLLKFSRENKFHYPARPWSLQNASVPTASGAARS
jgi:nucleoside-diphosphate-sugar epimerase